MEDFYFFFYFSNISFNINIRSEDRAVVSDRPFNSSMRRKYSSEKENV